MQGVLECRGQIRFSSLPWEISERLAQFRGNWLEFVPKGNTIRFRQTSPSGCPAVTGVACELITLLDSIPSEFRDSMPGGELSLSDAQGPILFLAVRQGAVQVRWPQKACFQSADTPLDKVPKETATHGTLVRGWARFEGSSARSLELKAFVDSFDGIYPEEDMPSECRQDIVYVRFRGVSIDPQALIASLQDLADPHESLQAVLEVSSQARRAADREYRIRIVDGCIETQKPVPA